MNIKSIVNKIKENPQYKGGKDDKYLYGLVKERLFLSDYIKNNLNKTITEVNDDEDEIEIEPENIEIQKTPSSEEDQNDSEESPESEIPEKPETFEEPTEYEEPEESPEDFDEEPSSTTTSTPSSIPTSTIDDTEPEEEPEIVKPTPITDKLKKKKPEDNGYIEISVDEARELLSYKGKIFTAVFTKRSNGELRALYGMTGVRKYTKGGELPYSPKEKNLIPVYDLKLGPGPEGYRTIPIEGLKALNINGRKYKINHSLKEVKINKPGVSLEDVKSLKNILMKDLGVFSLSEEEMKIARSLGWKEDGNSTTKYFEDNPHLIPQLYSKLRKLKQDNINEIKIVDPPNKKYEYIKSKMAELLTSPYSKPKEVVKIFKKYGFEDNGVSILDWLEDNKTKTKQIYNDLKLLLPKIIKEVKINKPGDEEFNKIMHILPLLFSSSRQSSSITKQILKKHGWEGDGTPITSWFRNNKHKSIKIYNDLKKIFPHNLQENMKKDVLKKIVKEVILEIKKSKTLTSKGKILKENQPSPQRQLPDREVIEKPETDTPKRKPRRRTLTPPTESPDTKPKAEGIIKENDKQIVNKIASRFQKLKK